MKIKNIVSIAHSKFTLFALLLLTCTVAWSARGSEINQNGNPGDWTSDLGGPQPLTTYATGGPNGGYTVIQDVPGAYGYGYGSGGYSFFGAAAPYAVTSPFSQSIDIYINTAWAAGGIPSQDGFWIDMAPNTSDPNLYTDNQYGEHNFRVTSTGSGQVNVGIDGNGTLATITQSGWYQFQMIYVAGATPTSLVNTTMNIIAADTSTLVATTTVSNDTVSSALQTQYLDGSGYVWLPVWAPGFAGGDLSVADVNVEQLASTPDSGTTLVLMGLGFLGLVVFGLRNNRLEAAK